MNCCTYSESRLNSNSEKFFRAVTQTRLSGRRVDTSQTRKQNNKYFEQIETTMVRGGSRVLQLLHMQQSEFAEKIVIKLKF